jgi:hypothetical protein
LNNTDALLKSLNTFLTSNGDTLARFGARVAVMSVLLDVTLPKLTLAQCVEITKLFRDGIEDTLSLMDDIPVPGEYRSTLLEQTNLFLAILNASGEIHS